MAIIGSNLIVKGVKQLNDYLISLQVKDSGSLKALVKTQEPHIERKWLIIIFGFLITLLPTRDSILFGASDLGLATLSTHWTECFCF